MIRQHIVARGRGASWKCAVAEEGRVGDWGDIAHALVVTHVSRAVRKQALLPLETMSERGERALEEKPLGVALKKVAPTAVNRGMVIVVSDEEDEALMEEGIEVVNMPVMMQDGRKLQFIPRLFSPKLHKVQEWDVNNQIIYQTGQHIEFADKGGLAMRGILYCETDVSRKAGMAQVRLDFWQPGPMVPRLGVASMQWAGMRSSHHQYGLGGLRLIRGCRWGLGHHQDTGLKRGRDSEQLA
ncbi:hypothetical protein NDU88_006119 [Pleurodeles waltl]|uniref:Uncharacterized protein n=1 Tax=Pleurodeles waltl TaxID=8319 RepID=A0AAV7TCP7_PLEWA|nr:hypothetical protein NDU88_006119 [Pleurodeles waltl]